MSGRTDASETTNLVELESGEQEVEDRLELPPLRAVVSILLSPISFAFGVAFARGLKDAVPPFELSVFCYVTEMLLVLPLAIHHRSRLRPEKRDVPWLLLAASASCIFNVAYLTSTKYLPGMVVGGLVHVMLIGVTSMAAIRDCTRYKVLATVITTAGIVAMVVGQLDVLFPEELQQVPDHHLSRWNRTDQISSTVALDVSATPNNRVKRGLSGSTTDGASVHTTKKVHTSTNEGAFDEATGLGLVAATVLCLSVQFYTVNKKLRDWYPSILIFWIAGFGVLFNVLFMTASEHLTFPTDKISALFLIGHASTVALANISKLVALQIFHPALVSLNAVDIIVSLLLQYALLKYDPGHPVPVEIVGAVLMILGNTVTPIYKLWSRSAEKAKNKSEK